MRKYFTYFISVFVLFLIAASASLLYSCGKGVEEGPPTTTTTTTTTTSTTTSTGATTSTTTTTTSTTTTTLKVATPTFVLSSGSHEANTVLVTIECLTSGATIYYTLDGLTPTTSSTQYTAAVSLETSKTVKAVAVKSEMASSDVASAWYDLYWWQALSGGVDETVRALVVDPSGNLYAGGDFTNYVAKWDGASWTAMDGLNNSVYALAVSSETIYAGGTFTNRVARWDGSSWVNLGSLNGNVYALAVSSGGTLFAGGNFTSPKRVAKWTDPTWSALGAGLNATVEALSVGPGALYAGGRFTQEATPGGTTVKRIAKWAAPTWEALGDGMSGPVFAIAVDPTRVYAGGNFSSPFNNIAVWESGAWGALGEGTDDYVFALRTETGMPLHAGGSFTSPGSRIAKWSSSSSSWSTLGSGINDGSVRAIAFSSTGDVYAGGDFTQAGGIDVSRIAKWGKKY